VAAGFAALADAAQAGTAVPLYSFCRNGTCTDGSRATSPILVDKDGNLFGTTSDGGKDDVGVVYELSPDAGHTTWTYKVIAQFCGDCTARSNRPFGPLIMDRDGNIYGAATTTNVTGGQGGIYELVKNQNYNFKMLYTFCQHSP